MYNGFWSVSLSAGYPQPQYKWFKDGVELSDFTTEHFHRIVNTRREDGGIYQCMAKNDVGAILSKKLEITVACEFPFVTDIR